MKVFKQSVFEFNCTDSILLAKNLVRIPEDIGSNVIDLFFTIKNIGKNTGQDLVISHNTVSKKHSGSIELESENG